LRQGGEKAGCVNWGVLCHVGLLGRCFHYTIVKYKVTCVRLDLRGSDKDDITLLVCEAMNSALAVFH